MNFAEHSFHDESVWKSMVAKVEGAEGVMAQSEADEASSLKALRKASWSVTDAVARIIRERDEALARQLQREEGGLRREGARPQPLDLTLDPVQPNAESRSATKAVKQAVSKTAGKKAAAVSSTSHLLLLVIPENV